MSKLRGVEPARSADQVSKAVGRLLGAGTVIAVVVVAAGAGLLVLAGRSPVTDQGPGLDVARLASDVSSGRPEGLLWAGLLLSLALPSARVALSLFAFARRGDRSAAAVAAAILAVLALSLSIALATR